MYDLLRVMYANLSASMCAVIVTVSEHKMHYKSIIQKIPTIWNVSCEHVLTLNIPSLARQRCLPSWGPRRTPWFFFFFCNFSTVWYGRLFKLCFLVFWNYNSVIQALLASNILCLFISTEVTGGTELLHTHSSLITHPASEQCHLLSIVSGPFFKFTTFKT